MPKRMIQDVLNGKYPGVYLNPSITCIEEFYGFFGTEDQYKKVYKRQKEAIIAKDLVYYLNQWGTDLQNCADSEYRKARELAEAEYEDWWAIFKEQQS